MSFAKDTGTYISAVSVPIYENDAARARQKALQKLEHNLILLGIQDLIEKE
ncbi:MAG: folate-dependent phosphoribosylglycinamide formyltransferase PurN, partial [bacterium]